MFDIKLVGLNDKAPRMGGKGQLLQVDLPAASWRQQVPWCRWRTPKTSPGTTRAQMRATVLCV
jgi:hypothetical protein